jgi:hypothetical protein
LIRDYRRSTRWTTQSVTALSATGEIVSSIALYSATDPGLQVWKRWFTSGETFAGGF